jgi:hypothetical protein
LDGLSGSWRRLWGAWSLLGLGLNWLRLRTPRNCAVRTVFYDVDAAENNQKPSANGREHTRPEQIREARPPRRGNGRHNWLGVANDSFGFQLRANGNPHAISRSDLRGKAFGCHYDRRKIREQILAVRAAGEMFASFGRKRTKTFGLQNCFEFLTLHTADSAGHRAEWLRPQKSHTAQVRVTPSTLAPILTHSFEPDCAFAD